MPRLQEFSVDKDKAREGVWVPVGPNFYMKISYAGNAEYIADLEKRRRPYRTAILRGQMDDSKFIKEAAAAHLCRAWGEEANGEVDFAGNVIDDAENLFERDGETVIPCNEETCLRLFTDDNYPEFWREVDRSCVMLQLFREDDIEDIVGN